MLEPENATESSAIEYPMNALSDFIKQRVPDKSVADVLADIFRKRIVDGEFLPGMRLVEAELAKLYGVSRGPIREAIRRLSAEGLIEAEKHRSPTVRGVGREQFRQMFEVRAILEGFAARLAAQRINASAEHRKWARAEARKWRSFAYCGEADVFVSANTEFHERLTAIAGQEVLAGQIRLLAIPGYKAVFKPLLQQEEMKRSSLQHADMLDAILDGDDDRAEALMRDHVMQSGVRLTAKFAPELFDRRIKELERLRNE
ncbi:MAG TPA: GntR family transcriptional regulator [Sphingopyxis sp.]|nr:GntR family transcriptional regulator [Sphingopyxis sp.]HMP44545.1 GntR family transcriptional regulator [Sphingopyxis sp.]HMQ20745.1 GntR family transcriptional regulator [Sphingopyxis sp.]